MKKPVITVKQLKYVTTITLKGVPFVYAVMPNSAIKHFGIVTALLIKAADVKAKGFNKRAAAYTKLASVLKA